MTSKARVVRFAAPGGPQVLTVETVALAEAIRAHADLETGRTIDSSLRIH